MSARTLEYKYIFRQDTSYSDTTKVDSLKNQSYQPSKRPTYTQKDRFGDPFSNNLSPSPLLLEDPASLKMDLEIDTGMNYTIYEKIGDINYRPTSAMTFQEFNKFQDQKMIKSYWQDRSSGLDGESAVSGRRLIPKLYISPVFDRIFGGSYVDIQPNGFVNLDFGGRWQRVDNPDTQINRRSTGGFNYDQQISMNVVGKVGEKLAITANFDNNNSFDFQNNLKVEYTGYEEDIIKKIEIGNISMPVANSLMTGGQSLFGIKTQLQFGKLFVTAIASRQQGRSEVLPLENGFQGREFEVRASDYDENRHFFLGHFFRDNYETWLSRLPQVISSVNITRVEVYIANRTGETETLRNFVSLMDLGEGSNVDNANVGMRVKGPNDNDANNLFSSIENAPEIRNIELVSDYLEGSFGMSNTNDFERITAARKLDEREYTWNRELGYITLLRKLNNDEVLAVSYEYSFNGQNYKVGELSEDYQGRQDDDLIILKMLRPSKINTEVPTWDLMMKNIYNLNATQVSKEGFELRIQYRDDLTGIDNPSLHVGALTKDVPLLQVLGLDSLNVQGDRQRDGNFDFIENLTIDTRNGNVIFPVLEPFGERLERSFLDDEQALKDQFVFDTLYRTTRINAQQIASKNKFFIVGKYIAGSGSVKQLEGFNIAEGSVRVTAGNTPLTEGLDYTVNYNLGQVNIINEAILSSGKDIQIAYEKADLFNFQTRWLTGARFDYRFSDKINLGATILHLNERPGGISRFSVGDEPTKNTKYGFDLNYQQESRFLTKMIDALPIINTKEKSSITFNGEFAQILPGTSNIVNGDGTSYIDDFENAATPFNMGGGHLPWKLASTPISPTNTFDQTAIGPGNLGFGYKRAKIAWYQIDNTFYFSTQGNRPDNITDEDAQNHFVKQILPQEIFRQQSRQVVQNSLPIFEVAYFPHERGQYNYNTDLTPEGLLKNPETNYGGITRPITNDVNFNQSNIQYIQFWLMDPFLENDPVNGAVLDGIFNQPNTTGGQVFFNLGLVSEDILKDNRHSFENGLPADGSDENTTQTDWGKITTTQYLTDFFDNSTNARPNQDVGLDGLKSEEESTFFDDTFSDRVSLNAIGNQRVANDISADNFRYFLDPEYDSQGAKILERYKNFNGMEGNSPIQTSNQNFIASGTNLPENEDLNNDNTISDVEAYFEYKLDLERGNLESQDFVVDQVQDDEDVTWYLFRIPRDQFSRKVGDVSFESIKYMRMYLTGWQQPVVLRMANFQLVGSQWRKETVSLRESGFNEIPETETSDFDVSVVNIEENSVAAPGKSPYTLPPGISRDLDNTTAIQRQANEQSLQICVDDLEDGDGRAVFKTVSHDLIQYGRMKMFFHAEANDDAFLVDDDLRGFLRFGTDPETNYYEIEVPLKITSADVSGLAGTALQDAVWPTENEIDLDFNELYGLKSRRNREGFDLEQEFVTPSENGKYNLKVVGNPDMSAVLRLMIGVRNPRTDDLQAKSVCVWANELRVSDFDKQKGWAANARLSAQLADFATVNASTRYTSIGFGGIQQRISERTREETFQYDLSANVNLDKLIPGKTGLKVPMYVSYEQAIITPKFDPLDPDITLEASIQSFDTEEEREEYKNKVEDKTTRKSINFTNVRKEKTKEGAKSHIYDIENFSFNYAYSEVINSNVNTASFVQKQYRGGINYNFSPTPPSIEPFKNSEKLSSPYLQLIKDLNFSPLPTNISVRMDLDRRFSKRQLRNADLTTDNIDPYFEKYFTFNRAYSVRWNLFKSLSIDYSARANAIIDEPEGDINTQAKRDSIWNNIKNFGRLKTFDQNLNVNYRLPLDKFPLTDWVSADLRFAAGYSWRSASFDQIDEFGHIIQNNRDRSANGKIDMVKLYNKVKFLKSINTPQRKRSTRGAQSTKRDTTRQANNGFFKGILRTMMSLRSINVTYSVREGTTLPGFASTPYLFGLDSSFNAPGSGFVFGSQDPDIRFRAADAGWLVRNSLLTTPFTQNLTEDLSIRASIEPLPDIKIQLDFKRTDTGNFQELFRLDSATNQFASLTPSRSGSYSISFLSIGTAFTSDDRDDNSPVFTDFEDFRSIIQARANNTITGGGEYGINSQDVLVPAFIAAYGGRDPTKVSLNPIPKIPLPNWRLDYAGLSKIPKLKELFASFNITHAYSSTFSIGNYVNSNLYRDALELDNSISSYPVASIENDNGLVPVYQINEVSISERFSPLVGVNIRTKGRANIKLEWKKERTVSLQITNSQISEMTSSDISFDFGLTKEKMKIPFKVKGRTVTLNNDIQFRMTFTVRDTKTVQRKIDDVSTVTNGNINYQFRPTMSYVMNNKLNLTMYFERNINQPKVSNSFNRATTAFGFQLRFSLAQ